MIRQFIYISVFSISAFSCGNSVQPEVLEVDGKDISVITDPILIGHPELLTPLDSLTTNFSTEARTQEFVGTLYITFIVDENGKVIEPEVIKGGNERINKIAKDIVQTARFSPGTQQGKKVSVKYGLALKSN